MGKLFTNVTREECFWLFHNWGYDSKKIDDYVAKDYPHALAIHQFRLTRSPSYQRWDDDMPVISLTTIRRYIERELTGDCIARDRPMDYYYVPDYRRDSEYYRFRQYEAQEKVYHGYLVLHFELIGDATAFALRFPEFISDIESTHPDKTHTETEKESFRAC